MLCGIYIIRCASGGKCYIGSSKDIRRRFILHRYQLNKGTHHTPHLQYAWKKRGASAFSFEILEICAAEELIAREQWWMDRFPAEIRYNKHPIAGRTEGVKRSAATIEKHRALRHTEEAKAKMREARLRFLATPAGKAAMQKAIDASLKSAVRKRAYATRVARGKPLIGARGRLENLKHVGRAPGFRHSPETKAKMSASAKRWRNQER